MQIKRHILGALVVVGALAGASAALAAFPEQPVRLIVPFPPGGATDVVARVLAVRLSDDWKQTVLVENKPGAGGNIGAAFVAKSAPDGLTILFASPAEVAINQFLYPVMPFNAAKDLAAVAKVASAPLVLVVNAKSPADSVQSLVRQIKASESGVNFASSGAGGPQHLAGEWFRLMSGTKMTHVPYKGGAPAVTDLLGGHVDLFFSGLPPALPQIQTGNLRALAVSTLQRSSLLPQTPTLAEQGFPGFNIENWQGVFVPSGTPASVVEKISRSIEKIVTNKSFSEQLQQQGAAPAYLNERAFGEFILAERQKYSKLVKDAGAKID